MMEIKQVDLFFNLLLLFFLIFIYCSMNAFKRSTLNRNGAIDVNRRTQLFELLHLKKIGPSVVGGSEHGCGELGLE